MRPLEIRHWLGTVIFVLVLGIGIPVYSVQQNIVQKEYASGLRVLKKIVLSAPEDKPLNMPSDVATGQDGNVYVLDGVNNRVVVYDVDGKFSFQFGGKGNKIGKFSFPLGIATDQNGKVYVADSGNHRFQIFESNGKPSEEVPLPFEQSGMLPDPTDVVVDPNRERLYVADNDNHHVLVYDLVNHSFQSIWGSPGQNQLQFRFPFLMDISSQGYLFIVEPINTRVQMLNPGGKFVNFIGGWGIKPGQLFRPKGVAIYQDKVFVTDSYLGSIKVFNMNSSFLTVLADTAGVPIEFITPTGITIDSMRKRLYVVELKAHRVCRLDLE